jgi:hypothetical protein
MAILSSFQEQSDQDCMTGLPTEEFFMSIIILKVEKNDFV